MARKAALQVGQPYLVEWHDATFNDEQSALSEQPDQIGEVCYTLGWLVKRTRAGIRLAMEVDAERSESRYCMDIPKRMIRNVWPVTAQTEGT